MEGSVFGVDVGFTAGLLRVVFNFRVCGLEGALGLGFAFGCVGLRSFTVFLLNMFVTEIKMRNFFQRR
jgi:hypothetical protein